MGLQFFTAAQWWCQRRARKFCRGIDITLAHVRSLGTSKTHRQSVTEQHTTCRGDKRLSGRSKEGSKEKSGGTWLCCKCNTSTGSRSHYQYKTAGKKNLQSKVQLIEKKLVFTQTKRKNDKKSGNIVMWSRKTSWTPSGKVKSQHASCH